MGWEQYYKERPLHLERYIMSREVNSLNGHNKSLRTGLRQGVKTNLKKLCRKLRRRLMHVIRYQVLT